MDDKRRGKRPKELWRRAKNVKKINGKRCQDHQESSDKNQSEKKKNVSNQNHKSNFIIIFFRKNEVNFNKSVKVQTDSNSKRHD
jgi:hypothetical protein